MQLQNKIESLLKEHFQDSDLIEVTCPRQDDKHFQISICSNSFAGKSRIDKNRLVYAILTPLFESQELHAVTLNLTTPNE